VVSQQDKTLFLAEMTGVTPLPKDPRGRVDKPQQPTAKGLFPTDDLEALADLRALVEGRGAFTIQYTDEYMEGIAPGVDPRLAHRLHRGDYAVQAHIDLHGHTVEEAKVVVDRFLTSAYMAGQRCVMLIHGRGLNSKDNRPVLKEQVRIWLSHGRLSRLVLAFATAPVTDGGAGAVYVLLRRAPHFQKR
jgi:DNA-nicking Smr family endonuclease